MRSPIILAGAIAYAYGVKALIGDLQASLGCPVENTVTVTATTTVEVHPVAEVTVGNTSLVPSGGAATSTKSIFETVTNIITVVGPTSTTVDHGGSSGTGHGSYESTGSTHGPGRTPSLARHSTVVTETVSVFPLPTHPANAATSVTNETITIIATPAATTTDFVTSVSTGIVTVSRGSLNTSAAGNATWKRPDNVTTSVIKKVTITSLKWPASVWTNSTTSYPSHSAIGKQLTHTESHTEKHPTFPANGHMNVTKTAKSKKPAVKTWTRFLNTTVHETVPAAATGNATRHASEHKPSHVYTSRPILSTAISTRVSRHSSAVVSETSTCTEEIPHHTTKSATHTTTDLGYNATRRSTHKVTVTTTRLSHAVTANVTSYSLGHATTPAGSSESSNRTWHRKTTTTTEVDTICTDDSTTTSKHSSPGKGSLSNVYTPGMISVTFPVAPLNTSSWARARPTISGGGPHPLVKVKRSANPTVSATIDGVLVSWVNNFTPAAATTSATLDLSNSSAPATVISASSTSSTLGAATPKSNLSTHAVSATGPMSTAYPTLGPAPACPQEELGNLRIGFDDLPAYGEPKGKSIYVPIQNPYHHLFWADGFTYVPPPTDPFLPHSGHQLGMFNVNGNANVHSQNWTGPVPSYADVNGMFGAGENFELSAYWINVHSAWVGCAGVNGTCHFAAHGWKLDNATGKSVRRVHQNFTLPACKTGSTCNLQPIEFKPHFEGLTALQLVATAGTSRIPVSWYVDDIELTWSNNTCAAARLRAGSI